MPAVRIIDRPTVVRIVASGPRGHPGKDGLSGRVYFDVNDPNVDQPSIWVELNPDGSVKGMWAGQTT